MKIIVLSKINYQGQIFAESVDPITVDDKIGKALINFGVAKAASNGGKKSKSGSVTLPDND